MVFFSANIYNVKFENVIKHGQNIQDAKADKNVKTVTVN